MNGNCNAKQFGTFFRTYLKVLPFLSLQPTSLFINYLEKIYGEKSEILDNLTID